MPFLAALFANPLARKIGVGIAIVLALGFAYRRITNAAYESGVTSGKAAGMDEAKKINEAAWKKREAELSDREASIAEAEGQVSKDRAAIKQLQAKFSADLTRSLSDISTTVIEERNRAKDTPRADLAPALYRLLDDIRAIEAGQPGAGYTISNPTR